MDLSGNFLIWLSPVHFFSKAKTVPSLLTKVVFVLFSLTLKVHVHVHITSNP